MDSIEIVKKAETKLRKQFEEIDDIAYVNQKKVLDAFTEFRVSPACMAGTTGYGYDDLGRETLGKVYAKVFGAEKRLYAKRTHAHERRTVRATNGRRRNDPARNACRSGGTSRRQTQRNARGGR